MRIGILGSGLMGGKLGTIWTRAGHDVVFSYSHSEQKLKKLALDGKGKARAGTPREAAQEGSSSADPRCGVRSDRCRAVTDRAVHRAVHAAHRATRLRGRQRAGARVPV